MRQEVNRTIIISAVIILLLGISLSPGISAGDPENKSKMLSVWMPGITEDNYSSEMEVTPEQLDEFNNTMNNLQCLMEDASDETSSEGTKITGSEWEDIRIAAYAVIDFFKELIGDEFPDEEAKHFICSVIGQLLSPLWYLRQPIVSIGIGITWIPFYDYETFLGKMFRPIWIRNFLGFSISLRINPFPPPITYTKAGDHRVRSMLYTGLLINYGNLGINRLIGPQLLIGYGFNGMA